VNDPIVFVLGFLVSLPVLWAAYLDLRS
jgi:hypothetical protein